ncbi:hypothetical protein H2O64_05190 [Kordia sp. YSTF-M3]|uniref:Uncharacterized protein n=1 Tax=Kordia aestuariivivens TaxID=2759037 RepID=A0ABR7Q667_9FLAO|nr:hypothetical protein [Kordia aestuariivivens]MBC8754055.1 hypothetical protein [Kordia aestuariivivens]
MNKLLLSALTLLLTTFDHSPKEKFKILRENETATHELGISKFYFVHQTFADSFFMLNLHEELSYNEMTTILQNIYNGVTLKDRVRIEYQETTPAIGKVVYFTKKDPKKGDIFIMLTNFSNATREFEERPDPKDQLARWYFMKGDKLVYRKDLYSKEKEEECKKGEPYEIIDLYLFDDNVENDVLVKPLIDKLLASDTNSLNKLYGYLYLSEYHLSKGDLKASELAIQKMTNLYESDSEIPRGYSLIVKMGTTELEIMKRM